MAVAAAAARPLFVPITGAVNAITTKPLSTPPTTNAANAFPIPPIASTANTAAIINAAFIVLSLGGFIAIN